MRASSGTACAALNGALVRRNVMIHDRLHEAMREMAHRERTSMSEIVRAALEAYEPLAPYLERPEVAR